MKSVDKFLPKKKPKSVKIVVMGVEPELKAVLQKYADKRDVSLNQLMRAIMRDFVQAEKLWGGK